MASKQRADKQKEKEKKEKIILLVLVSLLVIVGAFELPKILKKSGGSTTAASSTALTTSTLPTTSPGGTPTSTSVDVGSLPNSNVYLAGAGKLSGFSLFNNKDPFGQPITSSTAASTTTSPTTTKKTTTKKTTTIQQGQYTAARISVNGASEVVALDASFPSASPMFVLKTVAAIKIEIGVAGGSFSSGQAKVTINKHKSVALVNTVDSMRYVIKFVAPLTAAQATSTTSGTTTSGTTTSGTTNVTTT